ncbi:MAG: hypothetical protein Q9172_005563 [Xanthocarpia lactea]
MAVSLVEDGLNQIHSEIKAVIDFEIELEKKTKNHLALLFNRIQLSNDRVMVANGAAMQAIMQTSQEEIKVSRVLATKAHRISESMKKDSLSMRTVSPFVETVNAKQWTDIFEDCSMHDAISSRDIRSNEKLLQEGLYQNSAD